MAYNKGVHSSSHRARSYALMLMLAFGAALLGAMMLHKLNERRMYNLLVKDRDRELLSLQLLLQKERGRTKEIGRKNEEMKVKIYTLRGQKMELDRRVLKLKSTMNSLKYEQKVMESAFEEKQNEIRMLQGQGNNLGKVGPQDVIALTENLMQKEAEIKELKQRLEIPVKSSRVSINNPTIFHDNLTANGTTAAQDKTETRNKEMDEHSGESATKYGDDDKHVTNEDVSKSKLNKFKDGGVTVEVEDEIQDRKGNGDRLIETYEHDLMQENWQVEGKSGGGTAGEKITDREQGKKNEDSEDDGGAGITAIDANGKENKAIREEQPGELENNADGGGAARKHGHESRTTRKHWRMNGMNMHTEKQKLDEIRQSEKQEDSFVQQNWSGSHINKTDKNAGQAKSNMFHEQSEELNDADVQKQGKEVVDGEDVDEDNDDSFKESQSEFDDEKMEYKDEIYESQFQGGL